MEWSQYLDSFIVLAVAHFIAVASPGPDFAVVTKNTISFGKRAGKMTALGVGCAILIHVSLALLGFTAILQDQENKTIQVIFYLVGASFLIYLGIKSLQAKPTELTIDRAKQPTLSMRKAFLQGFYTNALNIKAMLFFLYLFTSIVPPTIPNPIKIFFGLWLAVATWLWFTFIAQIFGTGKVRLFFQQFGVWFDRIMGLILIALAILLISKSGIL